MIHTSIRASICLPSVTYQSVSQRIMESTVTRTHWEWYPDVDVIVDDIYDRSCKNHLYPTPFTKSIEVFSGNMASG